MTVSPNRATSTRPSSGVSRPPVRRPRKGNVLLAAYLLPCAVGSGMALFLAFGFAPARPTTPATHTVRFEQLHQTVVAKGDLEPVEQSEVVCRVKAYMQGRRFATSIKWVVDNGAHVRRGALLAELDDAAFQDDLETRKILLNQVGGEVVVAEENYKIVASQNDEAISQAEIAVQLAELDLKKYILGDYEQTRRDLAGRILQEESAVEMWRERAAWSKRMRKKGFASVAQLQGDQNGLQCAEIALTKLRQEFRVLEGYTRLQKLTELETGKLQQAREALARCRIQARARLAQADMERLTKKRIHQRRLRRLHDVEAEIAKCKIHAPRDGVVIHHLPEQSWFYGGGQQPLIAQGEQVREGQLLMRIADLSQFQARVLIPEALVARVRGDVREALPTPEFFEPLLFSASSDRVEPRQPRVLVEGQEATIHVDAAPDQLLHGHVKQVALMPTQLNGRPEDVKVFQAVVGIDGPADGLKPDESAEVHIATEATAQPVLAVPEKAIFGSAALGSHRECLVVTPEGVQERDVIVGVHNGDWAEIKAGLEAGEQVLLEPEEFKENKSP